MSVVISGWLGHKRCVHLFSSKIISPRLAAPDAGGFLSAVGRRALPSPECLPALLVLVDLTGASKATRCDVGRRHSQDWRHPRGTYTLLPACCNTLGGLVGEETGKGG